MTALMWIALGGLIVGPSGYYLGRLHEAQRITRVLRGGTAPTIPTGGTYDGP